MTGGLLRFAWSHLIGDRHRSALAVMAILVAVTSFVVLTGSVRTQPLQVTEEVAENYRSTYDILVRPAGSATEQEQANGVVRPNFLSGTYGGISLDEVTRIAGVDGVEVAAPIAVLGQTMRNVMLTVDVADVLRGRDRAMVRFRLTGTARHGTASTTSQNGYLYLTRGRLTSVDAVGSDADAGSPAQRERRGSSTITACMASNAGGPPSSPASAFQQQCWSTGYGSDTPPRVEAIMSLPLTVQAIDPEAEVKLSGVDRAMVEGRALTAGDSVATDDTGPAAVDTVAAVMASQLPFDYQATLAVDELPAATADQVLATNDPEQRRRIVLAATSVRRVGTVQRDAAQTYASDIAVTPDPQPGLVDQSLFVFGLTRPGDVSYTGARPLVPEVVPFDAGVWRNPDTPDEFLPTPSSVTDTGFRRVVNQAKDPIGNFFSFRVVGRYDPDRLVRPSTLNDVPLETYRPAYVEGADAASRAALGDQPLRSDLNPAGYVQSPPALLVPLASLPLFQHDFPGLDPQRPVSSVRVRVSGVTGLDPVARERIRQVADDIHAATGLTVDITIGASLQNREVALPATTSGTPALLVNERWTKKGVAVAISQAIDLKSLVLFVVVLVSAALTVALIATASVQARRRELGTLACVGWTTGRRRGLVAAELAILGVGAGGLGALVAWPLTAALGIETPWWQPILAVPLGALLALGSGLTATLAAGRIAPVDAFRMGSTRSLRVRGGMRGPITLGLIMIGTRPARAVVAGVAVAVAVASGGLLAGVVRGFNGRVVGSFLGDAVALHVRTPDIAAAVVLGALGLTAVATVLLLSLREDAPAYAALHAIGWTDRALTRSLVTQGLVIGLVGSVVGSVGTVVAAALIFDSDLLGIATGSAVIAVVTSLACASIALVPAVRLRRLPVAAILAGG